LDVQLVGPAKGWAASELDWREIMDFVFVDREITQTVFDHTKKSIKLSNCRVNPRPLQGGDMSDPFL